MPLFHRLGLPDDASFLFDENPDPELYTEVAEPPAEAPAEADTTEEPTE
jgi:hypothetical protein